MIYQLKNIDNFDNFPKTIQHNPRDLPPALTPLLALDHWVCWRWELDSRGKWTKPPYQARNPLWNASSNDPSTWADHDSACKAVEAGNAHGVGFVLTDTLFAAFDLDDCIIEGAADSDWEISPWALQLIKEAGSYVEVTPSGSGLRIIGTAVGNPIHRKFPMPDDGSLEIYRKATRYITVTGVAFDDRLDKLINIDEAVDESVSRVCGPRETGIPTKGNGEAHDGRLPADLAELIRDGVPIGERSERFFYVVATLKDRGLSVDEIESLLTNTGIAEKYRGRLRSEIERCFDKAKPNENTDAKIEQLAALSPAEYEKARKETAKELGVRVSGLDALVKAARPKDGGDIVSDVEPWPDAVDGITLLGEIEATIKRFLVCDVFTPRTLSLWIAATWLADIFHVSPILNIVSPELRCGKTTCLDIVSRLVRRSMTTSNISPPAMFRSIEKFQPTLIIDEADAFFSENEDLRGIINSGRSATTTSRKNSRPGRSRRSPVSANERRPSRIGASLSISSENSPTRRSSAFAMPLQGSSKRWRESSPAGRRTMPMRSPRRDPPYQSP